MKFFKRNRCYNGGNQHNFKARHDECPYGGRLKVDGVLNLRRLLYYNVYVRDICTWCGKIVER